MSYKLHLHFSGLCGLVPNRRLDAEERPTSATVLLVDARVPVCRKRESTRDEILTLMSHTPRMLVDLSNVEVLQGWMTTKAGDLGRVFAEVPIADRNIEIEVGGSQFQLKLHGDPLGRQPQGPEAESDIRWVPYLRHLCNDPSINGDCLNRHPPERVIVSRIHLSHGTVFTTRVHSHRANGTGNATPTVWPFIVETGSRGHEQAGAVGFQCTIDLGDANPGPLLVSLRSLLPGVSGSREFRLAWPAKGLSLEKDIHLSISNLPTRLLPGDGLKVMHFAWIYELLGTAPIDRPIPDLTVSSIGDGGGGVFCPNGILDPPEAV